MKNKEIDFGIIDNAELSELESLSNRVPPAGSGEKKKILEMSIRKYDTRNNGNTAEETVSGSEPYRPRILRKILTAAACIAVVFGVAGGAVLLRRNGGSPVTGSENTTEAATLSNDKTEQHEVFFRKGDSPDDKIILTGSNIKKAIPVYMAENKEFAVSGELDEEGTEIFAEVTSELMYTDTPISIWVDGECVSAPKVYSSITNGQFLITGNYDKESAAELAVKLSSCSTDSVLTAGGMIDGNVYSGLIKQCRDNFIENAGDDITEAYYCEYDINGDDIPELFIQYYTDDPEFPSGVCELYSIQGESCCKLDLKSKNIWVHHNNKDGIIITQPYSEPTTYLVFRLNGDGRTTLLHEFRITLDDEEEIYTIDGVNCSKKEWNRQLSEIKPLDVEWLDELTQKFYTHES